MPEKPAFLLLLILMMLVGVAFLVMLAVVDAFPKNMVLGFIIVLLVMLVLAGFLFGREKKGWRITGVVIAALFILIYGLGIYYLASTYSMFARITVEDNAAAAEAQRVDVTEDPFNVYITGIDQWTVEKGMDLERSDVNMIMTINPKTRKIVLTSIPRDAYVPLHRTGTMDKLTHTGIYGVDETLNTIKDWTGIDMNYYVKVNFSACVHIVDAMDGVDVYSPVAFDSAISKYKYKKGMNHLNGHQALYFARERKAFNAEDQLRVRNQLRLIKAMMNKIMSSSTLLTSYGDLMTAISNDMETNMPQEDIKSLVKMQLGDLSKWDIKMQRMSGTYDMEVVASMDASNKYQVLKVSEKTFQNCMTGIDKVMNPSEAEVAKAIADRQKNSIISFVKGLKR
ncbi:MAG: LCP family protein [Clostridiales bacterium]|nr:LCP family protein [Candidatus Crickella equi]